MNNKNNVSLNLNIRGIGQSPTLKINEICKNLAQKGQTVYRLGLGQSPFPVPEPVVEALKQHAHEKDYLAVKGLKELRKAVAHFHRQRDDVEIKSNKILIGPGSKELMFILMLVYYGDVIIPTPCWVSYAPQAKIIGRNIKLIHTSYDSKWGITSDQLSEFLQKENDQFKPRLLVLNYPSNPVGGTYSSEELKKFARIARKYQLIILSDEIYGQLHYTGEHKSIARYYPEGTIISSGLSKWCGAGGWRLGTFAFPQGLGWMLDAMSAVASETFTSVSAPIQYAAVRAFHGGVAIDNYLAHVRRILEQLCEKCTGILKKSKIKVHKPEGGFYLYIDFSDFSDLMRQRNISGSKMLCEKLLEDTGVAILPSESFQRPPEELTARLAFVNFDGTKALEMSETIPLSENLPDNFSENYCSSTIEAMIKITDWVSAVS